MKNRHVVVFVFLIFVIFLSSCSGSPSVEQLDLDNSIPEMKGIDTQRIYDGNIYSLINCRTRELCTIYRFGSGGGISCTPFNLLDGSIWSECNSYCKGE